LILIHQNDLKLLKKSFKVKNKILKNTVCTRNYILKHTLKKKQGKGSYFSIQAKILHENPFMHRNFGEYKRGCLLFYS
jgi:hypothetical protein